MLIKLYLTWVKAAYKTAKAPEDQVSEGALQFMVMEVLMDLILLHFPNEIFQFLNLFFA